MYLKQVVPQSDSEIYVESSKEEGGIGRALRRGMSVATEGISRGIEVGAFFVQFLRWW